MYEIEKLVKAAIYRNTLVDVASIFGPELRLLSPEAKKRIRQDVFSSRPPTENMADRWKETWKAIQ